MLRIIFFNILYVGTSGVALAKGGWPERIGALVLIADFQLSHLMIKPLAFRYSGVEWPMFAVDMAAFLSLYALSVISTRYWPIWMAALQGCVMLSHLIGLRPDIIPAAYGNFVVIWSYLLLVILFAATARHRARLSRYHCDPAWRWQLPENYLRGGEPDDNPAIMSDAGSRD